MKTPRLGLIRVCSYSKTSRGALYKYWLFDWLRKYRFNGRGVVSHTQCFLECLRPDLRFGPDDLRKTLPFHCVLLQRLLRHSLVVSGDLFRLLSPDRQRHALHGANRNRLINCLKLLVYELVQTELLEIIWKTAMPIMMMMQWLWLRFIHSGYFHSASSSPPLLRGARDTSRILRRSFTPKRHTQLRAKALPKVLTLRLERNSNTRPFVRKVTNLPMSHHAHDDYSDDYGNDDYGNDDWLTDTIMVVGWFIHWCQSVIHWWSLDWLSNDG